MLAPRENASSGAIPTRSPLRCASRRATRLFRERRRRVASRNKFAQIAPAVATVKLASVVVKPYRAERLVEPVRRVRGITEEQHGRHAALYEPTRECAEKKPPEALTLNALQQIDLVWLSARDPASQHIALQEHCDTLDETERRVERLTEQRVVNQYLRRDGSCRSQFPQAFRPRTPSPVPGRGPSDR